MLLTHLSYCRKLARRCVAVDLLVNTALRLWVAGTADSRK
jgi:hypothetical protein